jgi:hypothetical protein
MRYVINSSNVLLWRLTFDRLRGMVIRPRKRSEAIANSHTVHSAVLASTLAA